MTDKSDQERMIEHLAKWLWGPCWSHEKESDDNWKHYIPNARLEYFKTLRVNVAALANHKGDPVHRPPDRAIANGAIDLTHATIAALEVEEAKKPLNAKDHVAKFLKEAEDAR